MNQQLYQSAVLFEKTVTASNFAFQRFNLGCFSGSFPIFSELHPACLMIKTLHQVWFPVSDIVFSRTDILFNNYRQLLRWKSFIGGMNFCYGTFCTDQVIGRYFKNLFVSRCMEGYLEKSFKGSFQSEFQQKVVYFCNFIYHRKQTF